MEQSQQHKMKLKSDLEGKTFGRLVALRDSGKRTKNGGTIWLCLCSCGNSTAVQRAHLISRTTRSCGCLKRDLMRKRMKNKKGNAHPFYKHGDWRTRLYNVWMGMKQRCHNSDNPSYKYYGAKGIGVCSEWKNDYSNFKKWALANGYRDDLTIDRINSAGNYEPINCQFLTRPDNTSKQRQEWRRVNNIRREE